MIKRQEKNLKSTNNFDKNNKYFYNGSQTITSDLNNNTTHCRICGMKFDDMAMMQRHVLIEHMDKGDILED
jgi:hypothetical protein